MFSPCRGLSAAAFIGLVAGCTSVCAAQDAAPPQEPAQSATAPPGAQPANPAPAPVPPASPAAPADAAAQPPAQPAAPADAAPTKKIYTVPAGTKVLLQLRSAVDTRSAKPGDGVYLASTFPVVIGNRVMIPAGVYVQGVVDRVQRAGHVKGKAQLDMHFTSIIFPNGSVGEVPGVVNSVPGAKHQSVAADDEGTISQDGDKGRHAGTVAEIALPTSTTVGAIGGLGSGHPIAGGLAGVAGGLAAIGIATLFTRGADVDLEPGTQVEMVLQRPLLLEEENLAGVTPPNSAPAMVPAAQQPRPITNHRPRIMCPPGSLGCG
jgi:type IV secretion system protein VirB10